MVRRTSYCVWALSALSLLAPPPAPASQDAPAAPPGTVLRAVRTATPPAIDGRLQDEVWGHATPATEFRQRDPLEGEPATERTEVRILYDDEALYVGVRMHDREASLITRRLSRRDDEADADRVIVYLDPRHDHLTGASFQLSAAGVQSDEYLYDDTRRDDAWDAVWAGRVSTDEEGWAAEMRIPYSQLRFPGAEQHTWGINVERVIRRKNEEAWLVLTPKKERGLVSRMAHLVGLDGIAPRAHLELLPYAVSRAEFVQPDGEGDPFNDGSRLFGAAGIDVKWGVTSGFTLDATVNPDFGQVELDPAVINLTAFETYFDERRPFFTEGAQIFNNYGQLGGGYGEDSTIFYSRRIGRGPQGGASAEYVDRPTSTTILGAAKLTGKTSGGWSIGLLEAVTSREQARMLDEGIESKADIEPLTNYFVGRVLREWSRGGVGVIGTSVARRLGTAALENRLTSHAAVVGSDAYHFFDNDREWLLTGQVSASRVQGSAASIERLQRSSSRYFQRPDNLRLDPSRTTLGGWSGNVGFGRESGALQVSGSIEAVSAGFESNDLGYLTRADRVGAGIYGSYQSFEPGQYTREWEVSVQRDWSWNFARQNQGGSWEVEGDVTFLNYWDADIGLRRELRGFDDRLTRGGPAGISPAGWDLSAGFGSDSRKPVAVEARLAHEWNEAGGWETQVELELDLKASRRLTISTGPELTRSRDMAQYVASRADALAGATFGRRYVFGELDQTEVSMQTRVNLLLTPTMSLQVYAQPLLGFGRYDAIKEFARPGTFEFLRYGTGASTLSSSAEDREYEIDPDGAGPASRFTLENPDFNEKSLRLQAVFRWEWKPGSTLYLVWTDEREDEEYAGQFDLPRDIRRMLRAQSDDVFEVKVSYWLGR